MYQLLSDGSRAQLYCVQDVDDSNVETPRVPPIASIGLKPSGPSGKIGHGISPGLKVGRHHRTFRSSWRVSTSIFRCIPGDVGELGQSQLLIKRAGSLNMLYS